MDKAEIQHLVSLVEHKEAGFVKAHGATIDQIKQAAGGGNEDVCAAFKLVGLHVERRAADHEVDPRPRAFGEADHGFLNLFGQLTRWRKDKAAHGLGLRLAFHTANGCEDGKGKGGCLACARLGEAEHVTTVHGVRDGFGLNGGRLCEAELLQVCRKAGG